MAFDTFDQLQVLGSWESDETAIEELSALELVELIEHEEQFVAKFEQNRELGASALLHRIANFAVEQQDAQEGDQSTTQAIDLIDDLHVLLDQIEAMTDHLDLRSATLDRQEIAQADIAAMLLEAQTHLANRINQVQAHSTYELRNRRQNNLRRAA